MNIQRNHYSEKFWSFLNVIYGAVLSFLFIGIAFSINHSWHFSLICFLGLFIISVDWLWSTAYLMNLPPNGLHQIFKMTSHKNWVYFFHLLELFFIGIALALIAVPLIAESCTIQKLEIFKVGLLSAMFSGIFSLFFWWAISNDFPFKNWDRKDSMERIVGFLGIIFVNMCFLNIIVFQWSIFTSFIISAICLPVLAVYYNHKYFKKENKAIQWAFFIATGTVCLLTIFFVLIQNDFISSLTLLLIGIFSLRFFIHSMDFCKYVLLPKEKNEYY